MKLEQFSAIVLLNLDRSFDISQQWQFSILSSLKTVLDQRNSEPKKHTSNYSSGKNSSFSQLHFFTREVDQYKNTRHLHSSIKHQELFFYRICITSYFRPVNIAKFFKTTFYTPPDVLQNRCY